MKKIPQPGNKPAGKNAAGSLDSVAADSAARAADRSTGESTSLSDDVAADESPPLPLLPGTEEPRSLGDLMREAEASVQQHPLPVQTEDATSGGDRPGGGDAGRKDAPSRARRSKRPSRAQSRRFARERALQALYQWDVSSAQSSTVRQEFYDTQDMSRVDVDYFTLVYNGVSHDPDTVDGILADCLDRPMADLDPIERAVLRIAAFELSKQLDIPARVVINEGIEITKRFGADKGHRYVNGVLDKLAMSLRPLEMKTR